MPGTSKARPAYVEDENPATGDGDLETRLSASGANSGAKRSSQSLKQDKLPRSSVPSDSGVSGLSQPSKESGGMDEPVKPSRSSRKGDEAPAKEKRRPTLSGERDRPREGRRETRQRSPEKSSKRRESKIRQPESAKYEPCTDPNCKECPPQAAKGRPRPSALDTNMDINYPPFTNFPPASPGFMQASASAHPGKPIGSRPRGMSAAGRPVSYNGVPTGPFPAGGYGYHPGMPSVYPMPDSTYDHYIPSYASGPLGRPGLPPPATQPLQGSPIRPSPLIRPALSRPTTQEDLDYSARGSMQSIPQVPTYNAYRRKDSRDADDFDVTTRPGNSGRRSSFRNAPGAYPVSDTPESSPERPPMISRSSDRDIMPPPVSFPSRRPSLRHSLTTSEVVPRSYPNSTWPVIHHANQSYDLPSEYYDTDHGGQAVVADSRPRRQSGSRYSEHSYRSGKTYRSDPIRYVQRESLEYPFGPARRMSVQGQSGLSRREADAQANALRYQDDVRGYKEDTLSAEWLRKEKRRSLTAGQTPSHASNSSNRSHKSRNSISSRTSTKGNLLVQYGEHVFDIPADHNLSIVPGTEGGRNILVIEDGRGNEKSYRAERSVRSTGQTSSGARSHRSRTESEASRGRTRSVRPTESRRRSDYTGEGQERPL